MHLRGTSGCGYAVSWQISRLSRGLLSQPRPALRAGRATRPNCFVLGFVQGFRAGAINMIATRSKSILRALCLVPIAVLGSLWLLSRPSDQNWSNEQTAYRLHRVAEVMISLNEKKLDALLASPPATFEDFITRWVQDGTISKSTFEQLRLDSWDREFGLRWEIANGQGDVVVFSLGSNGKDEGGGGDDTVLRASVRQARVIKATLRSIDINRNARNEVVFGPKD
jgi:hypothetical protein